MIDGCFHEFIFPIGERAEVQSGPGAGQPMNPFHEVPDPDAVSRADGIMKDRRRPRGFAAENESIGRYNIINMDEIPFLLPRRQLEIGDIPEAASDDVSGEFRIIVAGAVKMIQGDVDKTYALLLSEQYTPLGEVSLG